MISYREFKTADIEAVLALWSATPGVKLHGNGEDSPKGIERSLLRNEGASFVAVDSASGEIVGAVLNGYDGRRAYVYHLTVRESYRRQGIATELLRLTEEYMNKLEIRKLALFVLNENETAHAFYKALGWQHEDIVRLYSKIIRPE